MAKEKPNKLYTGKPKAEKNTLLFSVANNTDEMLELYMTLGFGHKVIMPDGKAFSYTDIANYLEKKNGTITFSDFLLFVRTYNKAGAK